MAGGGQPTDESVSRDYGLLDTIHEIRDTGVFMTDLSFAIREANRCLLCYDSPCFKDCASGINPKYFIRKIRWNDIDGAVRMLRDANILYGTCSYLCPECDVCMKGCVSQGLDSSINIPRLQRFVFHEELNRGGFEPRKNALIKGPVAIIGAGPAGLSTASYLAMNGIKSVVFEESALAGRIFNEIIPAFKLPKNVFEYELEFIKKLGVEFNFNQKIANPKSLLKDYKAVVLATGLWKEKKTDYIGYEKNNVMTSFEYLSKFNKGELASGGRTIIIGGGNTAIDCARCAIKSGKEAIIIYRRTQNKMPAYRVEFDTAVSEGVDFIFSSVVRSIHGNENAESVKCLRGKMSRTDIGESFVKEGNEFEIPANEVVIATGQQLETDFGIGKSPNNKIAVRQNNFMTMSDGIFAVGDAIGCGTVVSAVGMGKKVANVIVEYLHKA